MKLTEIGKDIITVDEENNTEWCNDKIHIIKLKFNNPTNNKVHQTLENYKKTNRFIIDDNVRFYNYLLKDINKKYYIMNVEGNSIVSFFKRNNKVVLNTFRLSEYERDFLEQDEFLIDLLSNLEVMITNRLYYQRKQNIFQVWPGNLILSNGSDI